MKHGQFNNVDAGISVNKDNISTYVGQTGWWVSANGYSASLYRIIPIGRQDGTSNCIFHFTTWSLTSEKVPQGPTGTEKIVTSKEYDSYPENGDKGSYWYISNGII